MHDLEFFGLRADASAANNVAAKINLCLCKLGFTEFSEELGFPMAGEDFGKVDNVLFQGVGKNHNVVHVRHCVVLNVGKEGVHGALEGGGGVTQTKRHDKKFKTAMLGLEGGALAMLGVDTNLMEALGKVHLSEVAGLCHRVEHLVDLGDRTEGGNGDAVEAAVVDAEAEGAVLLLGEEDACTEVTGGLLNPTSSEVGA